MKFIVSAVGWVAIALVAILASNVVYVKICEHPAMVNTRARQLHPMLEECKAVQPGTTIAAAHDFVESLRRAGRGEC